MAIEVLEQYLDRCDQQLQDAADLDFYGHLETDVPAMNEHFRETTDAAFLFWLAFDFQLDDGSFLVDRVLQANPLLSAGERRYLEQLRETAMAPYQVVAVRPGESVVLRRLGTREEIAVRERTASTTLKRWDMLVTRLNPAGPSGGPEIEMGAMLIPRLAQQEIEEIVEDELDRLPDRNQWTHRFKSLGAVFHQIWLKSIVDPRIPALLNSQGDPLVFVTMRFEVHDEARLRIALDSEPSLEWSGDAWSWLDADSLLGTIRLSDSQLILETQSEPRADRGRQLIAQAARDAVSYRDCDRVDMKSALEECIRRGERPEPTDAGDETPRELKDQLFQEHMARHQQQWLKEQIPALDHQTPRDAAKSSILRPRLVGLLKEFENEYLDALAAGEPAYDATWLWDELNLSDHPDAPRVRHPLWLAHESMEQHLPGITGVISSLAERRQPDDSGIVRGTIVVNELLGSPVVPRFLEDNRRRMNPDDLLAHLELYSNYELHRRKTFWVDESLAWMLANTQVDAESQFFRLPFPSYVLVYTDRHTLGLAERALASDPNCPLRGQMLAVLCAYVVALEPNGSRIKVGITFDAFAGQPPHLRTWELHVDAGRTLEQTIADALGRAQLSAAGLFRPLLEAVVNATLFTTSAGSKVEQYRVDRSKQPNRGQPKGCLPGDSVYYLPGKITISHMRKLSQVARGPSGRALMHRFMVRGHWRRPNPKWKDQTLRWIEPYWRGPSLASIIEREYRLEP